jgi:hypothetical protein
MKANDREATFKLRLLGTFLAAWSVMALTVSYLLHLGYNFWPPLGIGMIVYFGMVGFIMAVVDLESDSPKEKK